MEPATTRHGAPARGRRRRRGLAPRGVDRVHVAARPAPPVPGTRSRRHALPGLDDRLGAARHRIGAEPVRREHLRPGEDLAGVLRHASRRRDPDVSPPLARDDADRRAQRDDHPRIRGVGRGRVPVRARTSRGSRLLAARSRVRRTRSARSVRSRRVTSTSRCAPASHSPLPRPGGSRTACARRAGAIVRAGSSRPLLLSGRGDRMARNGVLLSGDLLGDHRGRRVRWSAGGRSAGAGGSSRQARWLRQRRCSRCSRSRTSRWRSATRTTSSRSRTSAPLGANFTHTEPDLVVWGPILGLDDSDTMRNAVFPGLVLLVLAIGGAIHGWRSDERRRRITVTGLALTATGVVLAIGTSATGWRRYAPYRLLYELGPPFDALRATARAWMIGLLGLGLLAGLGAAALSGWVEHSLASAADSGGRRRRHRRGAAHPARGVRSVVRPAERARPAGRHRARAAAARRCRVPADERVGPGRHRLLRAAAEPVRRDRAPPPHPERVRGISPEVVPRAVEAAARSAGRPRARAPAPPRRALRRRAPGRRRARRGRPSGRRTRRSRCASSAATATDLLYELPHRAA